MTQIDSSESVLESSNDFDEIVEIIIVGSGFGGLGMGARLKQTRHDSFLILERADDVGGAWRDNTYPGAACDVPSPLYSFSFRPNPDWTSLFAPGREIFEYLQATAREEGLMEHIRFNTPMTSAKWNAAENVWIVKSRERTFKCRYLITATGHLSDWKIPDLAGKDDYQGDVFHSAAWRHDVSLSGKKVGVVGSGASAIQVIPEIAKSAERLVVFQRSPAYVVPRREQSFDIAQRRMFRRNPAELDALRESLFWLLEQSFAQRLAVPRFIDEVAMTAKRHLESQISDTELRAKLTPNYTVGCKRVLMSNTYYPALSQDNVHVESAAAASFTRTGLTSTAGNSFDLDVVIFATGFEAAQPPYAELVYGVGDISLADRWNRGMQAFASTTVSGFPNLFLINGPNTSLGHNSAVFIIEAQLEYILGAIEHATEKGMATLEVRADAEERYAGSIDEAGKHTVWLEGGCQNWYTDHRSGRLTLIWPDYAYAFRDRNGVFSADAYSERLRA